MEQAHFDQVQAYIKATTIERAGKRTGTWQAIKDKITQLYDDPY